MRKTAFWKLKKENREKLLIWVALLEFMVIGLLLARFQVSLGLHVFFTGVALALFYYAKETSR